MSIFENIIIGKLIQPDYTEAEKAKIIFGVQLLLTDFYKLIAVYGVSILLDCLLEVFIMHVSFLMLRQVCFGYHFVNNIQCFIWSIVLFPIFCKIQYIISANVCVPILLISIILLVIFSPVGTKKHPVINQLHKKYLRKKCWYRVIFILIISYLLPQELRLFVSLGVVVQTLLVLIQYILNIREVLS